MALLEPQKKGKLARHWPLWTWAVIIVFVVLLVSAIVSYVLFIVTGGGVVVYVGHKLTEKPGFCAAMCHVMKESVDSWRESSHEGIICAECHNKPGPRGLWEGAVIAPVKESWLMITANYGHKPIAVDIADESCMREHCHKMRLLHGKASFKRVVFDHAAHLERIIDGKKLKCVSCHSQMVMGTHMAVTEQVCFICHFKESLKETVPHGCPLCHEGPIDLVTYKGMSFDHKDAERLGQSCEECHSDISHGKGESNPEKCKACHEEEHPEEKVRDAASMHESHVVVHNAKCFDCHDEINHSIPSDFEVPCGKCHVSENAMYRGLDRGGDAIMPNKKADPLGMDCIVCHTEDSEYRVTEETCRMCHEGKKRRTIEDIEIEFDKELVGARDAVSQLRSSLSKESKPSPKSALVADAAVSDLKLLEDDGSSGVHNIEYSKLIASNVRELVNIAKKNIQAARSPAPEKPAEKPKGEEKKPPHGDLGECSNCH
jgi:nitrate/TMAO reductase-like tetraheme cytochrome c subunit